MDLSIIMYYLPIYSSTLRSYFRNFSPAKNYVSVPLKSVSSSGLTVREGWCGTSRRHRVTGHILLLAPHSDLPAIVGITHHTVLYAARPRESSVSKARDGAGSRWRLVYPQILFNITNVCAYFSAKQSHCIIIINPLLLNIQNFHNDCSNKS